MSRLTNRELASELKTLPRQISKSRKRPMMREILETNEDGEQTTKMVKYTAPEAVQMQAVQPAPEGGRKVWGLPGREEKKDDRKITRLVDVRLSGKPEVAAKIELQARGFLFEGRGGRLQAVVDPDHLVKKLRVLDEKTQKPYVIASDVLDFDDVGMYTYKGGVLKLLYGYKEAKEIRIRAAQAEARHAHERKAA